MNWKLLARSVLRTITALFAAMGILTLIDLAVLVYGKYAPEWLGVAIAISLIFVFLTAIFYVVDNK